MSILALLPLITMVMEVVKRFIPNKYRDVAVPVLAIGTGIGVSWATGGHTAGIDTIVGILEGGAAGLGANGLYTGAKAAGNTLGVK